MKNIKDITLSIFAVIGFVAILSSFNNQTQQETHGTPESHVWELVVTSPPSSSSSSAREGRVYLYNKITGEVRKYSRTYPSFKGVSDRDEAKSYLIMRNIEDMQPAD